MSAPLLARDEGPFDAAKARRLFRSAGFGATDLEVRRAVEEGLDATLDLLLGRSGVEDPVDDLEGLFDLAATGDDVGGLRAYLFARMLRARAQLREKAALFWHGHFATSIAKVRDPELMAGQWRTFLDFGLGRFDDLVAAMVRDPALLVWLDGVGSRRGRPNENLARELFELFTLGVGHYGEDDVKEAARALTGFVRIEGRFRFEPAAHDDGEKRILGRTGRFGPEDVARLCARHPASARRLASRLLRFFVGPSPEPAVAALAERLVDSDLNVAEVLRALFTSKWFFDTTAAVRRVLSPVEYVVGVLRSLGVRADAAEAARHAARMGQVLLAPPTVEGWEGGRAWIHTPRLLEAVRFAHRVARGKEGGLVKSDLPLGKGPDLPERLFATLAAVPPPPEVRGRVAALALEQPSLALAVAVSLPEVQVA